MTPAISIYAQSIKRNYDYTRNFYYRDSVYLNLLRNVEVKKKFEKLSSIWKIETMLTSSSSDIVNNSAYQNIIKLGPIALQFIIDDLKSNDALWFFALQSISGENPIKKEHQGIFSLMKQDWLNWAENNL
ncbi:MAG: hypothetical protein QM541_06430 [Flavobacterium sp.]|nr:hypothetical protein [Flavobacterium sp.]